MVCEEGCEEPSFIKKLSIEEDAVVEGFVVDVATTAAADSVVISGLVAAAILALVERLDVSM